MLYISEGVPDILIAITVIDELFRGFFSWQVGFSFDNNKVISHLSNFFPEEIVRVENFL